MWKIQTPRPHAWALKQINRSQPGPENGLEKNLGFLGFKKKLEKLKSLNFTGFRLFIVLVIFNL